MADKTQRGKFSSSRGRGGRVSRYQSAPRVVKPWQSILDDDKDNNSDVVRVRNNRPIVRGFANVGAVFSDKSNNENSLHPQIIKMARKSGMLNISNQGFEKVPSKVFHLYEMDQSEASQHAMSMSFDSSSDDRWWESVDLTKLYLNSNIITELPPDIRTLSCLVVLDISDNRLTSLPCELGELRLLQTLIACHNKLETIPDAAMHLTELRQLKLDHNNLTRLPDLTELTLLDQLDVSHNSLSSLPSSVGYLNRLTKLNASHNKLVELPDEIGDLFAVEEIMLNFNELQTLPLLNNLSKLTNLYLCHNRLTALPCDIRLPSLRELHLANNHIKEISKDQIEGLTGLRVLDLRDNKLDEVPDEITILQMLERLDLANNTLSTIPYHIGLLSHLRTMPLEGNPLRLIRRDIVQRGTLQLLRHLREKLPNPASSYPGFGTNTNDLPDGGTLIDQQQEHQQQLLPDKWQLRNSGQLVYSEKATAVPEQLIESAIEAEISNVDLSGNVLTSLPDRLGELKKMKELVVSCNKLTFLPSYMSDFTHLVYLDIHANRLEELPDLSNAIYLRELNMTHNRFTSLPECLRGANCLEILFASDNRINELDVSLIASWPRIATLHVNNNNIGHLPPQLGNVTQIRSLQLEGNPFRVPRAAILAKGTHEVMSYLRSRIVPDQQ